MTARGNVLDFLLISSGGLGSNFCSGRLICTKSHDFTRSAGVLSVYQSVVLLTHKFVPPVLFVLVLILFFIVDER